MSLLIVGTACHYCRKFRSPLDIIPMPGGVKICTGCEQRHQEALEALSTGNFMGECSECGKKPSELKGDGRMAIHYEGGRYKAMCIPCDSVYVTKRSDIYGETPFGHELKLK